MPSPPGRKGRNEAVHSHGRAPKPSPRSMRSDDASWATGEVCGCKGGIPEGNTASRAPGSVETFVITEGTVDRWERRSSNRTQKARKNWLEGTCTSVIRLIPDLPLHNVQPTGETRSWSPRVGCMTRSLWTPPGLTSSDRLLVGRQWLQGIRNFSGT
jgi:hypothetical protein